MDTLRLFTFAWLTFAALWAVRAIAKGRLVTLNFVLIVHAFVTGLPLLLDVIVGVPSYRRLPTFFAASRDGTTTAIYCLFVSGAALVWFMAAKAQRAQIGVPLGPPAVRLRWLWVAMLPAPIVAAALTPDPARYLTYGSAVSIINASDADRSSYPIVAGLAFLAIAAGAAIIAGARRVWPAAILVAPFMAAAVWVQGKRFSVVLLAAFLVFALWRRGAARGPKLVGAVAAAVLVVAVHSTIYQATLRDISTVTIASGEFYEGLRIDFGRDDVIKQAIYAELHPEKVKILPYRGESLLFSVAFWVPRSMWPEKPMPYAQYATAAMLDIEPTFLGWGMTTSILDEAIANAGWFGMLLGPLVVALIARTGDRRSSFEAGSLTVFVACALQVLQFSAFAVLGCVWAWLIIRERPADAPPRRSLLRRMVRPWESSRVAALRDTRPNLSA